MYSFGRNGKIRISSRKNSLVGSGILIKQRNWPQKKGIQTYETYVQIPLRVSVIILNGGASVNVEECIL